MPSDSYTTDLVVRIRSFDGAFEDLPLSVQRAALVDRSFYVDAACRRIKPGSPQKTAWLAESGRKYRVGANIFDGDKLIEFALVTCAGCPVQWKCAAAAIEADERAGIWSDTLENLRHLQRRANYATILEMAESTGVSVQRTIAMLRTRLT